MLSILIPTYNYKCIELVSELKGSCEYYRNTCDKNFSFEILVADDASTDTISKTANSKINEFKNCNYTLLKENIGRSSIRNILAKKAQGEHLIFIDSDALLVDSTFIKKYMEAIKTEDIICGGIRNAPFEQKYQHNLRFKYEQKAFHQRTLTFRQHHPYQHFTTFNFLISRNIFNEIKFNETIIEYGHEDTLFGKLLEEKSIKIAHIDNPLIHNGIDSNIDFIKKTEQALRTLKQLESCLQNDSELISLTKKLEQLKLIYIVRLWHTFFGTIEKAILKEKANLDLFKLYKLGYYSKLRSNK